MDEEGTHAQARTKMMWKKKDEGASLNRNEIGEVNNTVVMVNNGPIPFESAHGTNSISFGDIGKLSVPSDT